MKIIKIQKNAYKLLLVILLALIIVSIFSNITYASQDIINGMDPSHTTDPVGDSEILKIIARLFSILQFIGTGCSLIAIMILGISYMFSSIEQKAEIKKKATPILIGSFIIVATVNILKLIQIIATKSF